MGRILLYIVAIPVVLVVLAALLIPVFVDEERLIAIASDQLQEKTGAQLTVSGPVSLSLFPRLGLEMADVTVDAPDSGTKLQAGGLSAGLAVMPLLRGSVEIDAVNLRDLTVTTVAPDPASEMTTLGLSNAELDALYAQRRKARETGGSAGGAGAALALPLALSVGKLLVENARLVTVDDDGKALSTVILERLSATYLNTAGRPVPVTASVRLPGADGGQDLALDIDGELRPDLDAGRVDIIRMEIDTTGLTQRPLSAYIEGGLDINTQVAELTLAFTVEQMRGNGSLRYAAFESPQIDADLSVNEFNPALLVLAAPEAAAEAAAPNDTGSTTLPYDALRSIDSAARLRIDRVVLDQHVLSNVTATLRAREGKITLSPVQGTLHDGDIDFTAELNARYNPATLTTQGSVESLDIASAVRAMSTTVGASGRAGLTWEISARGDSTEALTASLTGPIRLRTDAVTVQGINAQRQFCEAVALVNQESLTTTFPPNTDFSELKADINLAEGQARLDPLSAELPALGLTGNGTLDLAAQDFRASIRASIRDTAGLDPACRVNERLAALRWPVECKGNLADAPASWCRVDTGEILKDLAEGEVKRQVEKEAGKLLKKMFG
ncbi:MAG: AsmA family protein, partial [Chromatocurvus sp.]